MVRFVCICLGGAAGTGARFLVSAGLLAWLGPAFPFGTLAVNIGGSFLLGLFAYLGKNSTVLPPTVLLTITTGFMGGFTTYSTFSNDTYGFLVAESWGMAALNIVITVFVCLAATASGAIVARWAIGA
jgi:CrcB protein